MLERLKLNFKGFDWILFSVVIILLSFGLAEIYSIALGQGETSLLNFKKQLFFAVVGVLALFFFASFDYNNLRSYTNYLYLLGALLLVAVYFFGMTIKGTKGWFNFGIFSLQPVEFVKIILILFFAKYFSAVSVKINPFKHFLITGLLAGIMMVLVMIQPDFGSSLLLGAVWGLMILSAGFKKSQMATLAVFMIIALSFSWFFVFKDYQKQRIMTFINPTAGTLDKGYNVRQAIIAVGSGGLMGRGLGFGSQSQLKFLPESHTDFIFSVVCEELGFFGVVFMVGLFSILMYRFFSNVSKIDNDFGIFYLIGAGGLIFIEMFINISMNIGMLPVVGISLPFLSYGGSAIVAKLIMIGIAENIIIKSNKTI